MARLTGTKRRKKQSEFAVAKKKATAEQLAKSQKKIKEQTAKRHKSKGVAKPSSLGGGLTSKTTTTTKAKSKSKIARAGGQKTNEEIFGKKKVDALKIKHSEWKKARKEGTMDEWNKKYKKKKSNFSSNWD
tara:strand:- start:134 stop:526 length:393 start_codon:yes stop_codon:yes gene_type:complete